MLLDDVQSGLVDVVVVHRLDRLTRHVGDMQTLMSVFEQHGVALVCVTQSLDTSSSHGRLALHLWTSFAQFERELIGERIRDKRAAAKRRGLWHGSAAPLGYVLVQQRLVIEPQEASIVRDMFTRFAAQSSVITLLQELDDGVVASGTDMQRMSARPMALALETATYHPFPSNDGYDITASFCKSYLLLGLRLERLICQ
jgi:DNA invertase Pin-like site-specific DNA recombinase